ncbi:SRPBCC domain-containing protein [Micromonospora sp. NPDC050397]|uniref:SRPBCC family protein n=1 Tax=Micromonospora sp. NPDC050397 TaxID=3364279 RepID=UPI00384AF7A4
MPRDEVWRALTMPDRIREWFGWPYDGLDQEIQQIFVDGARPVPPDRIELEGGQEIQLEDDGQRTIVRVVLATPPDDKGWAGVYDVIEEGWTAFLEQLRFYLERHADGQRQAVYLTGTSSSARVLALLDASAGQELFHRSRFQQMVVDRAGNLVGVTSKQSLRNVGSAPMTAMVTCYGLPEDAFAELRDDWIARWRSVADDVEINY